MRPCFSPPARNSACTAQLLVLGQGLAGEKTTGQLVDAALSGDLAGSVKSVASDVLRAGDEAIRKEGLS